ncbi:MAG: GTPase ObgE [bacterium]
MPGVSSFGTPVYFIRDFYLKIMFVDEVTIEIHAGDGGDGCVAFLREKFKPRGGPAGGNGGRGGNVYVEVDKGLLTLQDFRGRRIFKAGRGGNGEGKKCQGARGKDTIIKVPPGTSIFDMTSETFIGDIGENSKRMIVAKGGKGGLGNANFATSVKQAPRKATNGQEGEVKSIKLELRIIADIGLVGLPSAGKSSLVSLVSTADPKMAEYHFTTLSPKIGHIFLGGFYRVTIADLPGLIEDAHEGRGLGIKFLKHIQRTSILVHLISWRDEFASDPNEFCRDRDIIINEMMEFDKSLLEKTRYTVLNKIDLINPEFDKANIVAKLQECHGTEEIYALSIKERVGVEDFIRQISEIFLKKSGRYVDGLEVDFTLNQTE